MANNRTLTVIIVLLSIFMARSHAKGDQQNETQNTQVIKSLTDYKEQMFKEGSNVTLWCSNVTKFKWHDLIYVVWNISKQSKKCYIGLSPEPDDTCRDGKKLHNSTDGVSLSIFNISMQDEGFYICDLSYEGGSYNSLNISVRVIHLSARLDPDNKTAVCTARFKKKAPTLHWEHDSSVLSNITTVEKSGPFNIIKNQVNLNDNINISGLVCVATYPSVSDSVKLHSQDFLASVHQKTSSNFELIAIPAILICFSLVILPVVYVLLRKFNTLSTLKMLCCKSKISPPADDKPPQPADVEEVEPYASYIQRVNSIYNSSAELFNA